jgi:hypothetical protein
VKEAGKTWKDLPFADFGFDLYSSGLLVREDLIAGWSTAPRGLTTAPRGQVIEESLGQLPKKLAAARACWQGPKHHAPIRDETGWTTPRSLGEVGTNSVHSNPVCLCGGCTFLDEDSSRRHREKRGGAIWLGERGVRREQRGATPGCESARTGMPTTIQPDNWSGPPLTITARSIP